MRSQYEVFKGKTNANTPAWFWHLKAKNGEIVAVSEGYATKDNAERGAKDARRASRTAKIVS